ncbi:Homeodomain-like protein [Halteromyces radiatus]|uniref:Homeodomain-like protein n=1 Tax=Halteromyces radiatus TaxID=101107 RepID=UPI00221ED302|nr:Homeodomain-like protein [Halteromyces radiatus]KAI8093541.1 Homeodomain-like protein [Halteromyces radiatus]
MTSTTDDPTGVFSVFKQDTNRSAPFYCRWTTEEDKLLMAAVKKYGPHKWSLIAQHVPDRTPVQCSTRWLGALNPNVHKGRWSPEEDEALTEAVKKYSNRSVLPWNRIAQNIPNRTGIQCQARWTEALDPTVRKGRWKKEEDDMLRAGVSRFGCCWIRVSGMIYGRTQRQCRTRWNQIKSRKEKARNKDQSTSEQQKTEFVSLSSPTLLEEKLTPPISPMDQQQDQQLQWMNLPRSITVAVDPCETDYFCLSPPSPSSSLDDMLTLPDDEDVDHHDSTAKPQSSLFIPCEFYRFDPELPSSLMLPDSDLMLNDLLSHQFSSSVL